MLRVITLSLRYRQTFLRAPYNIARLAIPYNPVLPFIKTLRFCHYSFLPCNAPVMQLLWLTNRNIQDDTGSFFENIANALLRLSRFFFFSLQIPYFLKSNADTQRELQAVSEKIELHVIILRINQYCRSAREFLLY